MMQFFKSSTKEAMNFLRYVGPGLLVTVGFIDPGNWASNIAAGSGYGYTLLVSALSKGGFSIHTNSVIMIARC